MKKRIRLTNENDPLTQTDQVLAGFEQLNQLSRQPIDKSTSQQPIKSTSQLVDPVEEAIPLKSAENKPFGGIAGQQVDLLTSQLVGKSILKKATFQLDNDILQELDQLHLKLQLEYGKAATPYKEVIVEEAIARFLAELNANEAKLLQDLDARQKKRDR